MTDPRRVPAADGGTVDAKAFSILHRSMLDSFDARESEVVPTEAHALVLYRALESKGYALTNVLPSQAEQDMAALARLPSGPGYSWTLDAVGPDDSPTRYGIHVGGAGRHYGDTIEAAVNAALGDAT